GLGYLIGSALAYSGLFDLLRQTPAELLYFAVTAAMLYACVRLQSRALLLTTVLAMLGFIGYFSAEHFGDSLGWPISLILMGVAFTGVATLAMRIKQHILWRRSGRGCIRERELATNERSSGLTQSTLTSMFSATTSTR